MRRAGVGAQPAIPSEAPSHAFDQPAPPLLPTIVAGDLTPAGAESHHSPGGPAPNATPAAEAPCPHHYGQPGLRRFRSARRGGPASAVGPYRQPPPGRPAARAFAAAA